MKKSSERRALKRNGHWVDLSRNCSQMLMQQPHMYPNPLRVGVLIQEIYARTNVVLAPLQYKRKTCIMCDT